MGCNDGWVMGYDLRQTSNSVFSYKAHSALGGDSGHASRVVEKVCYVNEPIRSIISCSLDGSVFQKTQSGDGREILCDRSCLSCCAAETGMGVVATGGQSGYLFIASYACPVCCISCAAALLSLCKSSERTEQGIENPETGPKRVKQKTVCFSIDTAHKWKRLFQKRVNRVKLNNSRLRQRKRLLSP